LFSNTDESERILPYGEAADGAMSCPDDLKVLTTLELDCEGRCVITDHQVAPLHAGSPARLRPLPLTCFACIAVVRAAECVLPGLTMPGTSRVQGAVSQRGGITRSCPPSGRQARRHRRGFQRHAPCDRPLFARGLGERNRPQVRGPPVSQVDDGLAVSRGCGRNRGWPLRRLFPPPQPSCQGRLHVVGPKNGRAWQQLRHPPGLHRCGPPPCGITSCPRVLDCAQHPGIGPLPCHRPHRGRTCSVEMPATPAGCVQGHPAQAASVLLHTPARRRGTANPCARREQGWRCCPAPTCHARCRCCWVCCCPFEAAGCQIDIKYGRGTPVSSQAGPSAVNRRVLWRGINCRGVETAASVPSTWEFRQRAQAGGGATSRCAGATRSRWSWLGCQSRGGVAGVGETAFRTSAAPKV